MNIIQDDIFDLSPGLGLSFLFLPFQTVSRPLAPHSPRFLFMRRVSPLSLTLLLAGFAAGTAALAAEKGEDRARAVADPVALAAAASDAPHLYPELVHAEKLPKEAADNVSAYLAGLRKAELTDTHADRVRVEEAVLTAMRATGFYRPTITLEKKAPTQGKIPLAVSVTPDAPVLIADTRVNLTGEAAQDPDFLKHLETLPLKGTRLNHGDYERFKAGLSALAAQKGYFDAEFAASELGVALNRREAFWRFDFASGRRYRFGDVGFEGSQIDEAYLENILPFEENAPFDAEKLALLSRRLSDTGWFETFLVVPDFEAAHADPEGRLPIDATLTPRKANSIETGVGYATDVGPRLRVTWKKPWINRYGHSLSLTTEVSKEEPTLDTSYRIPVKGNPLEEYWILQGGYKHTDLNDTRADTASFTLSRWWEFESGWQRSVRVRTSYDKFTQGDEHHSTLLVYPGVSFSRIRSRGGAMPYWADSQRYSVDFSSEDLGSDATFCILQMQQSWIRTVAERHRFIFRAQAGYIETDNFSLVPPDLRFFAGGDRSIRGYKYKSVSPKNPDGTLSGASVLLTGSVEYQLNLTGKWWGALFYDAGEAVEDIKKSNVKEGAGLGVRWLSPVGPVKLDLAFPLNDKSADDFQILIGLGAEL